MMRQAHNQRLIERQNVLAQAWQAQSDPDDFGPRMVRHRKFDLAGFDPIWR